MSKLVAQQSANMTYQLPILPAVFRLNGRRMDAVLVKHPADLAGDEHVIRHASDLHVHGSDNLILGTIEMY